MQSNWEPPTDHSPTARGVRFGCGGLLGIIIGARLAWELTDFEAMDCAIGAGLGFVVVGVLASGAGDEIWAWLTDLLR